VNRFDPDVTISQLLRWELSGAAGEPFQLAIAGAIAQAGNPVVGVTGDGRGATVDRAIAAGAKRIVVFERNPAAALFLNLRNSSEWRMSGVSIQIVNGDPRTAALESGVAVFVSEAIGPMGDSELFSESLTAFERFLSPEATVIPAEYALTVVPLSSQYLWILSNTQNHLENVNDASLEASVALSKHQEAFRFVHRSGTPPSPSRQLDFAVTQGGVLHGIGVWFSARLFGDIWISSSLRNGLRDAKGLSQVFLPICSPFCVKTGEIITLSLARTVVDGAVSYEWAVLAPRTRAIQNWRGGTYAVSPKW
jgi:protein arginine N-methyltransferase 5